jgi:hypothetical protein
MKKKFELDEIELEILRKLIFEESLNLILEESKSLASKNVILSILKQFIQMGLVVAKQPQPNKRSKSGFIYDSDHMGDFNYQITSLGLELII